MPELHELSVAEAAAQIREGALSPVALAESLLARIDALDSDLQAWVTIDRCETPRTGLLKKSASQLGGTVSRNKMSKVGAVCFLWMAPRV